jgi:nucleoporin NDC1
MRVIRTFGEKLSAFKFPPRIAKKLQEFADYS